MISHKMIEDMFCMFYYQIFRTFHSQTPGSYEDDEWFNSFFVDPVLNDKMITDAAQPPRINSEHSYSSNMSDASSPLSDDGKLEGIKIKCSKNQKKKKSDTRKSCCNYL